MSIYEYFFFFSFLIAMRLLGLRAYLGTFLNFVLL